MSSSQKSQSVRLQESIEIRKRLISMGFTQETVRKADWDNLLASQRAFVKEENGMGDTFRLRLIDEDVSQVASVRVIFTMSPHCRSGVELDQSSSKRSKSTK